MPSKKKKYNARFPPARIKKIMQTDEDVGKVAAAVPVIISRALELFIESLILKASETTRSRNAKTLSTAHIKQTIQAEKKFDFLKDLVANVPDVQPNEEEGEGPSTPVEPTAPKPRGRPRKKAGEDGNEHVPKKRGRKRKQDNAAAHQENSDTEDADTDTGNGDEEEEEEEESENESDDAQNNTGHVTNLNENQETQGRKEEGSQSASNPSYIPNTLPTPSTDFPYPSISGHMVSPMSLPHPMMGPAGYPCATPPFPHTMAAAGVLPPGINTYPPMAMAGFSAGMCVPPAHPMTAMYGVAPPGTPPVYSPSSSSPSASLAPASLSRAPSTPTEDDYNT